jgi:hypothetical protein
VLARRLGRYDQTTRGHDDQPPRRGFGRTQQPEHGAVEMARQGWAAAVGKPLTRFG